MIITARTNKAAFPTDKQSRQAYADVDVNFGFAGAIDGLKYMVHVDWDKLMEGDTWINGATQATSTQHQSSTLKGLSSEIEMAL